MVWMRPDSQTSDVAAAVGKYRCGVLSVSAYRVSRLGGLGARATNQQAPQYYQKPYSASVHSQIKTAKNMTHLRHGQRRAPQCLDR